MQRQMKGQPNQQQPTQRLTASHSPGRVFESPRLVTWPSQLSATIATGHEYAYFDVIRELGRCYVYADDEYPSS